MNLLILLYSGQPDEGLRTTLGLGEAALAKGHAVSVFLAGEGTCHIASLVPLREAGAVVVHCTADAAARGWDHPGGPGRGSFVDLADLSAEADAVISL